MGARRALEERRHPAHRAERAHGGIDAAGNGALRALEERFVFCHLKSFPYWRARAAMSGASKRSEMTATRSAPASMTCRALSRVMPPIAQRGTPRSFLNSESGARTAEGLVGEEITLPKAT